MSKFIETTGKTVGEATQKGLAELNVSLSDVERVILTQAKKGFFGFGASNAKVRLTIKEQIKEQTPKASQNTTKKTTEKPQEKDYPQSVEKTNTTENEQKIKEFIDGLLSKMGIEGYAQVVEKNNDCINIDIKGDGLGTVIGRRGDTLDAVQYISNLVARNSGENVPKVRIDCENYRAKRDETLDRLAIKMGQKVLKYKKNMTLEPMNPYERRKIHEVLQNFRGVNTYSTGKEPNRRVVVAYGDSDK